MGGSISDEEREEAIGTAREHVRLAAQLIGRLGEREARLAWLLEDAMAYLDEPENQAQDLDVLGMISDMDDEVEESKVHGLS